VTDLADHVRAFLESQPVGALATVRSDGTPRQSVVYHVLDGDRLLISTESKRAKARDVARSGRASYCVVAHEAPWPSVTVEGPARILTAGIGAATAKIFAKVTGKEPDDPMSDETLAQIDRVVLELTIEHVYGVSYIPEPAA
jgi:PPOX class probable F420-dependent enzyme